MVEKVVSFLIMNKIIAVEEREIYQYGLELLVKKLLHVLMILLIGFIGGEFLGVLIFVVAYASIREYAGGYHAKTEIGCYCCTGAVTICTIFLLHIFPVISMVWLLLLLFACGVAIYFFSPQEALNRPLDENEKLVYRKKAHWYLAIEASLCLSGFLCKTILYGIACAWFVQSVMLFAGWCKNKG